MIGDVNAAGGEAVANTIRKEGGYVCLVVSSLVGAINMGCRRDVVIEPCREAVSIKCDVTKWDEQVALFELAMARFDAVDIVVSSSSTPGSSDTPSESPPPSLPPFLPFFILDSSPREN